MPVPVVVVVIVGVIIIISVSRPVVWLVVGWLRRIVGGWSVVNSSGSAVETKEVAVVGLFNFGSKNGGNE